MKHPSSHIVLVALLALTGLAPTALAGNRTMLRNICHLKGQEENTLNGMGLVVGLNGTGEAGDPATMRNLARAMELMGSPVSTTGRLDAAALEQLKKIKNVSLVMVTATVPATGATRGEKLDCHVMALNGKSLAGGWLAFAALKGPNTQDNRVFALCQGALQFDDPAQPMVARIHGGCQMQQQVQTPYELDGYVTLVLDKNHADFQTADAIVHTIEDNFASQVVKDGDPEYDKKLRELVHAENAATIRVKIPKSYASTPVSFVAELLEIDIYEAEPEARVVINRRAGSITISGDVEIGDVVVSHRNLTVETAGQPSSFATVDPGKTNETRLTRLVEALGNLKVPTDDIAEIIRQIDRLGKLHAKLIIE